MVPKFSDGISKNAERIADNFLGIFDLQLIFCANWFSVVKIKSEWRVEGLIWANWAGKIGKTDVIAIAGHSHLDRSSTLKITQISSVQLNSIDGHFCHHRFSLFGIMCEMLTHNKLDETTKERSKMKYFFQFLPSRITKSRWALTTEEEESRKNKILLSRGFFCVIHSPFSTILHSIKF